MRSGVTEAIDRINDIADLERQTEIAAIETMIRAFVLNGHKIENCELVVEECAPETDQLSGRVTKRTSYRIRERKPDISL